jgi:CBS-domain-containing membrane protein
VVLRLTDHPWLLPSLGGSCVILLGMPRGLTAQPRSLLGGHLLATTAGLVFRAGYLGFGGPIEIWGAAAAGAALALMAATRTIHSPAGANPIVVFAEAADWRFLLAFFANNLPWPWGAGPWPRFLGPRFRAVSPADRPVAASRR